MAYEPVLNSTQSVNDHPDYVAPLGTYVTDALIDFAGCFIQTHPREFKMFMAAGLILMGLCVGVDTLKQPETPNFICDKDTTENTALEETES